jgi:hypothetical protein
MSALRYFLAGNSRVIRGGEGHTSINVGLTPSNCAANLQVLMLVQAACSSQGGLRLGAFVNSRVYPWHVLWGEDQGCDLSRTLRPMCRDLKVVSKCDLRLVFDLCMRIRTLTRGPARRVVVRENKQIGSEKPPQRVTSLSVRGAPRSQPQGRTHAGSKCGVRFLFSVLSKQSSVSVSKCWPHLMNEQMQVCETCRKPSMRYLHLGSWMNEPEKCLRLGLAQVELGGTNPLKVGCSQEVRPRRPKGRFNCGSIEDLSLTICAKRPCSLLQLYREGVSESLPLSKLL